MRRVAGLAALAGATLALAGLAGFLALDLLFPFPWERLARPSATQVLARDGTRLRVFLASDERLRLPVERDEVAPELIAALIASEDRWFGTHPGVNPLAVLRALAQNLRAGRVVSGASTIPMQLARLAEPRPRTLAAKLVESFRALQLGWHLGDDAILSLYLNRTPYGGNLEGIGAASYAWFGKRPVELSVGEAALLVALPRAPTRTDPTRDPEAARRARDRVLDALAGRGVFPQRALAEARRQPVPTRRRALPFLAPHFARFAAGETPGRERVTTTLDPRSQALAEASVASRIDALRQRGVGNAAVVVLETGSRDVIAMVGSAGFFEAGRPGQVNGALARRSPGSTLKPFLYALAIDRGGIVPESPLLDVPTDFAGYVADNYDGRYRGAVTARRALVESLNAPAVRLLARTGLRDFVALLRRGGLDSLDRAPERYGLPLVLGAGEATLLALTNLYASLADHGLHRPLRFRHDDRVEPGERLFSPEAAHLVAGMLAELERPDLPEAWSLAADVPAVAWKTGTSYGHRDAWAIGFSARRTIGVWVGNLDGRAQRGISGARDAAPLLFDLFRALDPGGGLDRSAPPGVVATEVCGVSHALPGPFCPTRARIASVRGTSQLGRCGWHRRVFIDLETGERLGGRCLATRPHRATVLEVFPPELVAWWQATGQGVEALPRMHAACRDVPGGDPPRIVSPAARTPYRLRGDAPARFQKLALSARAAPGTARLWWYQDGRLLGAGRPGAALFTALEPGIHRLVVVDDAGRSDEVRYRVE